MKLATILAIALLAATASAVLGHSGTIAGTSTCNGWSGSVTLNHNVAPDRLVTVTTDIPGSTGISAYFDETFGLVWSGSGPALTAPGHVTLTIGNEFSQSLTLEVPSGCQSSPSPTSSTPTPSSSPTIAPSPTPTPETSPSATPSSSTTPSTSDAPSATPTGSPAAHLTPPPTSTTLPTTPPDRNAGLLAVLLTGLASGVLVFRRLRTVR